MESIPQPLSTPASRATAALAALARIIPPEARLTRRGEDADGDILVELNGHQLRVRPVSRGWPRDVRRGLEGRRRPDLVFVPLMSPGGREAARLAGVGWMDETGGAELVSAGVVISRSSSPPPRTRPAARWSPSSVAIAEALLCGVPATVATVVAATGYSMGTAQRGLDGLHRLGLLRSRAQRGRYSAREIIDFDLLLDEYANAVAEARKPVSLRVGLLWKGPSTLSAVGRLWDAAGIAWAATGSVAAEVLAPLLTEVGTADVYLSASTTPELHLAAATARLEAMEGGRLTLRPLPSPTTWRLATERGGIRVAPWPRVFADLRPLGVRGGEAAEHLREQMLKTRVEDRVHDRP